jgi:hypothetical protein
MEFRGKRSDMIVKYKEIFIKKLGARIEKIKISKLEKILPKIEKIIAKITKNTKITKEKRDKIISKIAALKEIIEDRLEEEK